jgi:3-demethoxyubiquinol 3-hydroxylase
MQQNFFKREQTPKDKVILAVDNMLKTLFGGYALSQQADPADSVENEQPMDTKQQKHAAGLMRINHCGEVCAQALYQGQSLTAKLPDVRDKMEQAAIEENDHLNWCATRLHQLDSRESLFNPAWYLGSFGLGMVAGALGDKWSLGFVAETEYQVVKHIDHHLEKLPEQDNKSRAILIQMRQDELQHAVSAIDAGGAELPKPIKMTMSMMSKLMTSSVYYL